MYNLTQEQADEVVRILGFDGIVEDGENLEGLHFYHLEDGTCIMIGPDGQVEHQTFDDDLLPVNMRDVESTLGPDVGVLELRREGQLKGYIDWFVAEQATPEQRHIHDLRVLDVCERMLGFTQP